MPIHEIIVYTLPSCAYCKQVKKYLKAKKLIFQEVDVHEDPKLQAEMIGKSGQYGVPVLDINGQVIVGFQKNVLDLLFD